MDTKQPTNSKIKSDSIYGQSELQKLSWHCPQTLIIKNEYYRLLVETNMYPKWAQDFSAPFWFEKSGAKG